MQSITEWASFFGDAPGKGWISNVRRFEYRRMKQYRDHTDKELVALLTQGHRGAFAAIYKANVSSLLNYVRRSIPLKEDCEEIVQEIFESLWKRREGLHHITSLRAYLFTMVKYKIVDYIRHNLVKRRYEENYVLFGPVYDHLSETINEPSDFQLLIDKSIAELPERCQLAFRLRLQDNLPYKDIAQCMGISTRTVEKHISAALRHLRSVYQNSYKAG